MKPILIEEAPTKVIVKYDSIPFELPLNIREQHQQFWNEQVMINPHFRNGEVFTTTEIYKSPNELQITVVKTDYKHYLYTIRQEDTDFPCKVIFTCAAVITNDNYIAFGKMNKQTSTPGRLQFTGGGLDESDLDGSLFNLEKSIEKELIEEMGISVNESYTKSFRPKFIKRGGKNDFWAIIFELKVDLTADELQVLLDKHNKSILEKGDLPEFNEFLLVSLDKESVHSFLQNDLSLKEEYLEPILKKYISN